MERALRIFAPVWFWLVGLTIAVSIVGLFIGTDTFWEGLNSFWEIFSPFNFINWAFTLVVCSPAIGALMWANRIRDRRNSR